MYIKKDDKVISLSGKDKGKTGKVVKAFPRQGKVVVEGINVIKVHSKPRRSGEKGQIIEKTMPVYASSVALVDPKSGKATRVSRKVIDGKKVRISKKGGATI